MIKYMTIMSILLLTACSTPAIQEIPPVEIRTIQVQRPAPILPPVDQLRLRSIEWFIITPENVDEQFQRIQRGELVLFAVTSTGYENLALNLSDIRALVSQQQRIIAIYQEQFQPRG